MEKPEFDPNKQYKVVLSDRLKDIKKEKYTLSSVQVDPKLAAPHPIQSATLTTATTSQDDKVDLHLTGAKGAHTTLKGEQKATPDRMVLLWDQDTQIFTLDILDNEISFDPQTNAATEPQIESPEASESSSDDDTRDTRDALIHEAGEPDADNPYDWRHQLRRPPSPARSDRGPSPAHSDRDLSLSPPPAAQPSSRSRAHRQASTPPERGGTPTINLPDADEADDEDDDDEADDDQLFGGGGGGGLEIVLDGANEEPHRGRRGRSVWRTPKPQGEPISLRSAANSRSPAVAAGAADPGAERGGSNADVEEMRLGSPMHDGGPPAAPVEEELEDDGDDDMAADFEEALQGDAGEELPPQESEQEEVSLVAQPESSSESEEE